MRAALLYVTMDRLDDAAAMLERCDAKDPLVPTLPATVVLLRFWRRDFDAAIAYGKQAIELHPYLQIVRVNYAQALEFSGRLPEALAQYKLASVMSPDLPWLRALEGHVPRQDGTDGRGPRDPRRAGAPAALRVRGRVLSVRCCARRSATAPRR